MLKFCNLSSCSLYQRIKKEKACLCNLELRIKLLKIFHIQNLMEQEGGRQGIMLNICRQFFFLLLFID